MPYEDIDKKIANGTYATHHNTLKSNRSKLISTQKRLSRKLKKGESKQVKANAAKIAKITTLLGQMNAIHVVANKNNSNNNEENKVKAEEAAEPAAEAAPEAAAEEKAPADKETKEVVEALLADFYKTLPALTKTQVEKAIKHFSDVYYNDGVSLISDEEYDRLSDLFKTKFGETLEVGAQVVKNKVKLPYFMGSMDKIKPDKNNLKSWVLRYPGAVCISDKLDGISALYIKQDGKRVLYTRGNGTIGQDITHMIDYIQIGDIGSLATCVVRGELIVSKANYETVKEGKRGARQMVSGLANQKMLTADRIAQMKLVEFVAYEVIVPEALKPSAQFTMLDNKSTFHAARWTMAEGVTIESLGALLTERKTTSDYEIDGIIVAHDAIYPRIAGNPEHAFAFKMSFADQQTTTEVLNVLWEVSKDGYLKPTVNFEPVNIGGVVIQYATGFNAAFIHNNGIGPGAFVDIIRSGDVIPYIKAVKSAAPGGPQMPNVAWHWNETHVDAVLDDIGANPDVQKRILLYFAQTLEIGFCGEGNISKIYDSGIHTIDKFIHMTVEDLRKEFAAKSAAKVISERDAAFKKATVVHWAVGTGIFGRGIGTKRVAAALEITPADLTGGEELVAAVAGLSGWSRESATAYVSNLPAFKAFMEKHGIRAKVATPVAVAKDGKLVGQVVLFTGWHPKDLEAAVAKEGGIVADAFTGKVTVLVIKDASVSNEKTKKALTAGVPVLTGEAFKEKYGL